MIKSVFSQVKDLDIPKPSKRKEERQESIHLKNKKAKVEICKLVIYSQP
jgi:hypothetical protein